MNVRKRKVASEKENESSSVNGNKIGIDSEKGNEEAQMTTVIVGETVREIATNTATGLGLGLVQVPSEAKALGKCRI